MKLVSTGTKKKSYRSIRLAAEAAGVPYMTFYMRLRMGKGVMKAMKQPVRKYQKQEAYNG
jgi:hypothetical protein